MGKLLGLLVGAIPGLALGGAWSLALPALGLVLGHVFDAQLRVRDHAPELDPEAQLRFARSLSALFVLLSEVDGEMTRAEAAAIRDFFESGLGFSPNQLQHVREALQEARRQTPDLDVLLYAVRSRSGPAERSLLLYALGEVAAADHPVTRAEWTLLARVAQGLELDDDVTAAMLHGHAGPRAPPPPEREARGQARPPEPERAPAEDDALGAAYARLGLTATSTDAEIKQAYRALAQKLHPDKLSHLGPRAVELATRAFDEVSQAYERVRRARGF